MEESYNHRMVYQKHKAMTLTPHDTNKQIVVLNFNMQDMFPVVCLTCKVRDRQSHCAGHVSGKCTAEGSQYDVGAQHQTAHGWFTTRLECFGRPKHDKRGYEATKLEAIALLFAGYASQGCRSATVLVCTSSAPLIIRFPRRLPSKSARVI